MARAAAIALALAAGSAAAQPAPTAEQVAQFRTCRAAAFYHLDGDSAPSAQLPAAFARTLLEQMSFVMAESLRSLPMRSLDEAEAAMTFNERFFLEFSQTVAGNRALAEDVAQREALLIECQRALWRAMRPRIDGLLALRERFERPYLGPAPDER